MLIVEDRRGYDEIKYRRKSQETRNKKQEIIIKEE